MMEHWNSLWNTVMTDYSKCGLYAEQYKCRIRMQCLYETDAFRLHFTNRFGTQQAVYRNVTLRTDHALYHVTYHGCSDISVPKGESVWTDTIELKQCTRGETEITFEAEALQIGETALLPDTPYMTTECTGTVGTRIAMYAQMVNDIPPDYKWHFGMDRIYAHDTGHHAFRKILLLGDSNFHREYFANAIRSDVPFALCENQGINGNRLLKGSILPFLGEINGKACLERIDLLEGEYDEVHILIGINDLLLPYEYVQLKELPTPEMMQDGLTALAEKARCLCSRQESVLLYTLLPCRGCKAYNGISEQQRIALNDFIRTMPHIDAAAILADPADPSKLNADFAQDDALHINQQGAVRLCSSVFLRHSD